MALTNFLVTLVGVGAVAFLMKSDLKRSSAMLRRNLKHVRTWLEEQAPEAEKVAQEAKKIGENNTKESLKP